MEYANKYNKKKAFTSFDTSLYLKTEAQTNSEAS